MKKLLLGLLAFGMMACHQVKEGTLDIVKIDVNSSDYLKDEAVFKDFDFVKLDTISEALLSDVSKGLVGEIRLYVLPVMDPRVFIFTKEGKYVNSLRMGQGPGEVRCVYDMKLHDGNLYAFDNFRTIRKYDKDGKYIEDVYTRNNFNLLMEFEQDQLLLFEPYMSPGQEQLMTVVTKDTILSHFPKHKGNESPFFFNLFYSDGHISWPMCDTIYHYDAEKIATRQAKDPHWVFDPLYAYSEEPHLALWLTGNKTAQSWVMKEEKTSFYQLHAYVANVLRRLGVTYKLAPLAATELYEDGMAILAPNGKQIGVMAIVAKKQLKAFDIDNPVYYADLDWNMVLRLHKQYKPVISDLPKYPEVKRDFALLVDKSVKFADLAKAALATEKKLLKAVNLFDVYEGKNLEAGKKSYALSFILQDAENTLKDKQIEAIMSKLQKLFEDKFGAKLR